MFVDRISTRGRYLPLELVQGQTFGPIGLRLVHVLAEGETGTPPPVVLTGCRFVGGIRRDGASPYLVTFDFSVDAQSTDTVWLGMSYDVVAQLTGALSPISKRARYEHEVIVIDSLERRLQLAYGPVVVLRNLPGAA